MKVSETNWMQLADYLKQDDRAIVPLGSTEQHAYLSLATDAILSERVALEAAEPLGVPVFPALAYGITPNFLAFPGSVNLRGVSTSYSGGQRHSPIPLPARVFGAFSWSTGMAAIVRPARSRRSGWPIILGYRWLCITGGMPPRPGRRPRRLTPWPRTAPGWRTSPGIEWRPPRKGKRPRLTLAIR